jgi:hypothetical protein
MTTIQLRYTALVTKNLSIPKQHRWVAVYIFSVLDRVMHYNDKRTKNSKLGAACSGGAGSM